MTEKKQSRLQPQIPHWYEDLPLRDAPLDPKSQSDQPRLYIDALRVDDNVLELSREATLSRGFMLPAGVFGLVTMLTFIVFMVIPSMGEVFRELPLLGVISVVFSIAFPILFLWGIKKSIRTPQNTPVRFIRKSRKVQALEYKTSYNPFAKWTVQFKEFDWDNVYAEMIRTAGYNTVIYSVQYQLWLAECEPGTTRVKDRIVLVPDSKLPIHEHTSWAYIRQFMEKGHEGLTERFYPGSVSFLNCVLYAYPYLDPTEVGRRRRERMDRASWVLFLVFGVLLFWLFIPMGIFEYIALKLAPKAQWPEEAERALRT